MTFFNHSAFFLLARTGLEVMDMAFLELLGPLAGDTGGVLMVTKVSLKWGNS